MYLEKLTEELAVEWRGVRPEISGKDHIKVFAQTCLGDTSSEVQSLGFCLNTRMSVIVKVKICLRLLIQLYFIITVYM